VQQFSCESDTFYECLKSVRRGRKLGKALCAIEDQSRNRSVDIHDVEVAHIIAINLIYLLIRI
jgi:hypothetical protein